MALSFEWDDEKAAANLRKHGVDFLDAAKIFLGPTVEAADDDLDYGEERIRAIGQHDGAVFVVVYTMRASGENSETIRLISAWKASKHDRERYYQTVAGGP